MYTISNVPAERYVYNFDKTLERVSSLEPDQRSVVSLSHLDRPPMTHARRLMWRRLGIIVSLCRQGSPHKSENSVRTELALLSVQIYCIRYVIDD